MEQQPTELYCFSLFLSRSSLLSHVSMCFTEINQTRSKTDFDAIKTTAVIGRGYTLDYKYLLLLCCLTLRCFLMGMKGVVLKIWPFAHRLVKHCLLPHAQAWNERLLFWHNRIFKFTPETKCQTQTNKRIFQQTSKRKKKKKHDTKMMMIMNTEGQQRQKKKQNKQGTDWKPSKNDWQNPDIKTVHTVG